MRLGYVDRRCVARLPLCVLVCVSVCVCLCLFVCTGFCQLVSPLRSRYRQSGESTFDCEQSMLLEGRVVVAIAVNKS